VEQTNSLNNQYGFSKEWLRNFGNDASQFTLDAVDSNQTSSNAFSVFLSHSATDNELASDFRSFLLFHQLPLRIDLTKSKQPENMDLFTANWIKAQIRTSMYYLLLVTESSLKSDWLLWELGVADCLKDNLRMAVVPCLNSSEGWQKYESIRQRFNELRPISPQSAGVFTPTVYLTDLTSWLKTGLVRPQPWAEFAAPSVPGEMDVHPFHRSGCAGL
jgi:hypothetical protein